MTEKNETGRPVNIKQEPSTEVLAETVVMLIRAIEQGREIRKEVAAE